ncbi:MAG: cupin domain-containing protein [Candidatus Eisenbacteria bacterium]|nr:cupin domain-containing protein [Candidatus Eisenbacteria bacterium]
MKRWRCSVCGYIHTGDKPPDTCPNCASPKEKFGEVAEDFDLIHMQYGQKLSYGQDVEVNPFFGNYASLSPYVYNLPVGKRVGLHKHPTTDELFFILKGKVEFRVGDRQLVAVEGDLVQGRMDIPHTFKNIGDEPAAFLSVKGPKPVDLVKLE